MAILDGIADAVVKLDAQANYTAMNRAAIEIFQRLGHDPNEMMGKSVWQVFPDVKGTLVERELLRALEGLMPVNYEFSYPPDKRWYAVRGYPSKDGIILIFRDMSKGKMAP